MANPVKSGCCEGMEETKGPEVTEIASLASRNLVGDLRELSVCRYLQGDPCTATARYDQETEEGRGRKGKGMVKEKRGNVRGEYLPRYFNRFRPRPTWRT